MVGGRWLIDYTKANINFVWNINTALEARADTAVIILPLLAHLVWTAIFYENDLTSIYSPCSPSFFSVYLYIYFLIIVVPLACFPLFLLLTLYSLSRFFAIAYFLYVGNIFPFQVWRSPFSTSSVSLGRHHYETFIQWILVSKFLADIICRETLECLKLYFLMSLNLQYMIK